MSGPDKKAEQKKIEAAKKAVHAEIKTLAMRTKKQAGEAKTLADEKSELEKKKKPGPDDKKRGKELDNKLKVIDKARESEAEATSKRIGQILKDYVPDDKEALPLWQKGMDQWYIKILNKEPGLDIGGGNRVNGSISVKDKKAIIDLTRKY